MQASPELSQTQGLAEVLRAYAKTKGRFITELRSPALWHHLDNKRQFRDWAKGRRLYPPGVPVHLVDQAAFEATEICARHIESVLAGDQIKARIRRRLEDEAERHYAYACLARYATIGVIVRWLNRVLRKALVEKGWPTVRRARSMSLDETSYSPFVRERSGMQPGVRQYVSVFGPPPRAYRDPPSRPEPGKRQYPRGPGRGRGPRLHPRRLRGKAAPR